MEIYTLTGPSGTGKSYRAMDICKQYDIDGVIDDGLFIYKGMVTAGESAKRCETKIGAVKAAIFNDEKKAKKVSQAIRAKRPRSILVLGTSDEMADLIIERLGIKRHRNRKLKQEPVIHRIHIEDITTEEERKEAEKQAALLKNDELAEETDEADDPEDPEDKSEPEEAEKAAVGELSDEIEKSDNL